MGLVLWAGRTNLTHELVQAESVEPVLFHLLEVWDFSLFEVSSGVVFEGRLLVEPLAAVAPKWLHACVRQHVSVELRLTQEP